MQRYRCGDVAAASARSLRWRRARRTRCNPMPLAAGARIERGAARAAAARRQVASSSAFGNRGRIRISKTLITRLGSVPAQRDDASTSLSASPTAIEISDPQNTYPLASGRAPHSRARRQSAALVRRRDVELQHHRSSRVRHESQGIPQAASGHLRRLRFRRRGHPNAQ